MQHFAYNLWRNVYKCAWQVLAGAFSDACHSAENLCNMSVRGRWRALGIRWANGPCCHFRLSVLGECDECLAATPQLTDLVSEAGRSAE